MSHKKQSIKMKIERGESQDWRIFSKKALIRDLQKTDTFNPFTEESKNIIHSVVAILAQGGLCAQL